MSAKTERKRQYLGRYKEARYKELTLAEEYDRVCRSAEPVSVAYDGAGRGPRQVPLDSYVVRCEKAREDLEAAIGAWQRVRDEVETCIAQLPKEDWRILLWQRYIDLVEIQSAGRTVGYRYKSLREVAEAMHYSKTRVDHMHIDALKHLEIPTTFDN